MLLAGTESRSIRRDLLARVRCERGTTLIELLIYAVASLFVLTAVITFLLTTFSQQNQTASRVATNNQAEQGLEQLVADLRQAVGSVSISNPTSTTTEVQFEPSDAGRADELRAGVLDMSEHGREQRRHLHPGADRERRHDDHQL